MLIVKSYHRQNEQYASIARNIMFYIKTFGGMGNSDKALPKDLWPLDLDFEDEKRMITTVQMAVELLNEF